MLCIVAKLTSPVVGNMVSLRFPFSFSQPPRRPPNSKYFHRANFSSTAVSCAVAAVGVCTAAVASSKNADFLDRKDLVQDALSLIFGSVVSSHNSSPFWASLSLSDNSTASSSQVTESRTGASFPSVIKSQRLLGVGVRRKSILGLKNIDVYAFGVYADEGDVKKCLEEKYGNLKRTQVLPEDVMENDVSLTVRLQIVYGRLSIKSVRNAFEDSVGSRLQKFGGPNNTDLLQRFTSQFKDEYKIPRGSVIELSREPVHVLHTTIDGKEVGRIQSELLCRSVLDLYIGDDPFDQKAKEAVVTQLASVLEK